MPTLLPAPAWEISRWFNSPALTLADLRGRVVVAGAFQMLCAGCVMRALPQLQRVRQTFPEATVAVIGLHTVFEHHAQQGPEALEAFLYEFRYAFPVGVDMTSDGEPLPRTMRKYQMQGTPTLLLVDKRGNLRAQHFGGIEDLALGAEIATLVAEDA